jgi:hypothetical protein
MVQRAKHAKMPNVSGYVCGVRSFLLSGMCALSVLAAPAALASLGSGPSEIAPCLKRHHLPAFTTYSLGATFAGLRRTHMSRSCLVPPPGPCECTLPSSIHWISDAVYGTCPREGFEGGCGPPLDIQSWPECDRDFSSYGTVESHKALRPSKSFFLSGSYKIPTAAPSYGLTTTIEMYTGQTTIVVFSDGPSLGRRAAHALARLVEPKLSSISAASLRAAAVSTRGCR